MNDAFQLNPQLASDCHHIGTIKNIELLLHKNAVVPWFILVPHTDNEDLLALAREERIEILDLASRVADYIRSHTDYKKINTGSIGNVVSQLHVHVVGRKHDDDCWPKPVWGNLQTESSYDAETIRQIKDIICT